MIHPALRAGGARIRREPFVAALQVAVRVAEEVRHTLGVSSSSFGVIDHKAVHLHGKFDQMTK